MKILTYYMKFYLTLFSGFVKSLLRFYLEFKEMVYQSAMCYIENCMFNNIKTIGTNIRHIGPTCIYITLYTQYQRKIAIKILLR